MCMCWKYYGLALGLCGLCVQTERNANFGGGVIAYKVFILQLDAVVVVL